MQCALARNYVSHEFLSNPVRLLLLVNPARSHGIGTAHAGSTSGNPMANTGRRAPVISTCSATWLPLAYLHSKYIMLYVLHSYALITV